MVALEEVHIIPNSSAMILSPVIIRPHSNSRVNMGDQEVAQNLKLSFLVGLIITVILILPVSPFLCHTAHNSQH